MEMFLKRMKIQEKGFWIQMLIICQGYYLFWEVLLFSCCYSFNTHTQRSLGERKKGLFKKKNSWKNKPMSMFGIKKEKIANMTFFFLNSFFDSLYDIYMFVFWGEKKNY
mmetsp:Transcript_33964/g.44982  ORF Transcript_33964/g.44982 Transcript_33964/m.44982 type:complete len:109 (+) Transcript_33964:626-952(+)